MSTRPLLLPALLAFALVGRVFAQPAPAAAPATPADQAPAPAAAPAAAPEEPGVIIKSAEPQVPTATKGRDASGKDTLSVDFPDEDIRTIVRNVADLFELNIIIPETLQGKTTIKLRDVTWRQIFQNVLAPVGYTFVEEGNIIKIISNDSLQQEPTSTEVFILNYAKAGDVMPTISGLVDTAAGGKIVVNTPTNSLVITERPTRMNKIKPILEQLDRATDQVMIETKFVEVTDGDIRNLGVNWSALKAYKMGVAPAAKYEKDADQTTTSGNSGSGKTDSATTGSQKLDATTAAVNGVATTTTTAALSNGLTNTADSAMDMLDEIVNTSTLSRAATAVFSADQFGFVISALSELSRTKVVSNPTIVTLNNTEATINVGEQDPIPNYSYNEQRGSFEVSGFNYKDIGINLKVTPQVNARGFIKLNVQPEVSQKQGSVNFGGAGGAEIPIIATRKATTTVSLKDGSTVGIGGLITSSAINSSNKVPLLGDIPVLGNLFKQKSKNNAQTNLLIFITAKVQPAEGGAINQVFDPRQVRDAGIQKDDLPGFRDGSDPFVPPPAPPGAKKKK